MLTETTSYSRTLTAPLIRSHYITFRSLLIASNHNDTLNRQPILFNIAGLSGSTGSIGPAGNTGSTGSELS